MEGLISKESSPSHRILSFRVIFNPVNSYNKQWVSVSHLSSDNLKFNEVWKESDSYHVDVKSSTKFYALQDGKILIKEFLEAEGR